MLTALRVGAYRFYSYYPAEQAQFMAGMRHDQQRACHTDTVMQRRTPDKTSAPRAILLTNIVLSGRSGTEVVTEQLADGLRGRGHDVMIFTPQAGALAAQMRGRGHVVVTDPAALPRHPDIIHAHHAGPAMAALAAHPGVLAIFVSHDATAPFDAAPVHPSIRRVLAVDERCRARLVAEGAAPEAVGLLPNGVDLSRIPARTNPLPARPRRAVVLSKHGAHLPAIRASCAAAGIALEEFGSGPGRMTDTPEALFASADLVFATARSALEAAAAGAGVVVCDGRGCAGFLTRARAEAWLPWNLGAGVLTDPAEEAPIAAAIAGWSATEAAAASALVRAERDFETLLDRIDALHDAVLAEGHVTDPTQAAAAIGAFIAGWVPNFDLQAPWRRLSLAVGGPSDSAPVETLPSQVAALTEQIALLAEGQAAIMAEVAALRDDIAAPAAILPALQAEVAALRDDIAAPAAILPALQAEVAALAARGDALEALLRRGPLHRLRDGAAALWRAVVPLSIRRPLHRWRSGRTDQPR